MSILIKGMDKPTDCGLCPFEDFGYCNVKGERNTSESGIDTDCPLIEVADRKTEPQTNADQHVQRVEYVGNDEKSRCWTCKHFERMHETPISSDGSYYTYVVCMASECRYEPKDEPTISKMEQVDKDINVRSKDCTTCKHAGEVYEDPCELCYRHSNYAPKDEPKTQTKTQNSNLTFEKADEPQTDCAWK